MSFIVINYGKLDDAIEHAEQGVKKCKKYIENLEDVESKLTSKQVTKVEDNGSVSTALSLARKKLDEAKSFKSSFTEYAKAINSAKVTVEEKDNAASRNITAIANAYLGKRSIFQNVSEFFYRQYVCFLDKVGGLGKLGQAIKNLIKNIEVKFDGWMESAKNWFKYGNGKYIKNIADALVGVVLAAATLIGVIATLPVSGPLMVAGLVVAGATAAVLAFTMIDASIQIDQNTRAYALGQEGKSTAARYYGDIDGFNEWIKRTDFGGKITNVGMGALGGIYDVTKVIASTISSVGSMILGVGKLGVTKNAQGVEIVDWNRAWTGYKYKLLHKAGLNSNAYQTGGFSIKTALSPDAYIKKVVSNKTVKAVSEFGGFVKTFGYTADTLKTFKNIEGIRKGVGTLSDPDVGVYEKIGAFMKTAGKFPLVDATGSDVWSTVESIKKLAEPVISAFSIPSYVTTVPQVSVSVSGVGGGGGGRF